jgi:hypothetical protein
MAKGGYKPGAGRPPGSRSPKLVAVAADDVNKPGITPLEYMLAVIRDRGADPARRDRMAIAAAPFMHPRQEPTSKGKKQRAQDEAKTAGVGTRWGSDLEGPDLRVN